jgi:hypothetical protein
VREVLQAALAGGDLTIDAAFLLPRLLVLVVGGVPDDPHLGRIGGVDTTRTPSDGTSP